MPAHVKVGGTWRTLDPRMKVGGVWKNATGGWVKVAGVWRKFYDPIITPTIVLAGSVYNTNAGAKAINGISVQANDFIVALCCTTGAATSIGSVADNVFGAYGQAVNAQYTATRTCSIHAQRATSATTINVTYTPGAGDTGNGFTVVIVRGGTSAANIFITGKVDNMASTAPSVGLSATPAANDVVLGIASGQNGPSGEGSGFTLAGNGSWAAPTNVVRAQYRNGGASSTVSWTGSATAHCACAVAVTPQ